MMKLHWSPRSPFVRKVMITAIELGLEAKITQIRSVALMAKSNPELMKDNPLSKIPCMVTEEGVALVDSLVICEYLQMQSGDGAVIPSAADARISTLNGHALANNWTDMLILWRNERNKDDAQRMPALLTAFGERTKAVLNLFEQRAASFNLSSFDLAQITLGVALAYMNYRFEDVDWREGRPTLARWFENFEQRPSVIQTEIDPNG